MTTTLIERLPGDWLDQSAFGDGWDELKIDPSEVWAQMFAAWLAFRYPSAHLSVCGGEIIGPATYVYPDADVQSDTPAANEWPELPASLYEEFREHVGERWVELIQQWHAGENIFGEVVNG